ncbi:MAG: amidohydrolase family protein [Clostridia bacterium]|nr:amidohydrolase family protein [Clostridia bacterium]
MTKTNPEINGYRLTPIWDGHMHPHDPVPIEDTIRIFKDAMAHFNYDKIVINALPSHGYADSFKAIYIKTQIPNVYANAGLSHYYDERDHAEAFLAQAKAFYTMGCDGFKMLEGKPDDRKRIGIRVDDPIYDKFYGFIEEKGLPCLMHVGDPFEFWDIDLIPKWALERGWLYDKSYPSLEDLRKEVANVLKKHPNLHLILAHFYFMSHDYNLAVEFMEKYPNVCIDLTPGKEMYVNFEKDLPLWRGFFEKYADRILYGSDRYNWDIPKEELESTRSHAVNLVRSFLEKEEFHCAWTNTFMHGFGFKGEILDKIYYKNAERLYGKVPRKVDFELLKADLKNCLEKDELSTIDRQNLKTILEIRD